MSGLSGNVASSQAVISLRSYMQPQGPTQQAILNFTTADSFSAAASAVLTETIAVSTTSSFDLATLFAAYTAPVFVSITDISNPGLGFTINISDDSSGTIGVGPNMWLAWMADGTTTLPTVYITNGSSTQELVISLGIMTQ